MATEIKILRAGDEQVLTRVAPAVFDDPIDPRVAAEFLFDHRHHLAVAVDGGLVVGFVSAVLYIHPDKPRPELWINEVAVAPSHRRRGVGRALLDAVLEAARNSDCVEAWVLTDRSNDGAMRLYSSAGGQAAPNDQVMFTFHFDGRRVDDPEDPS
jgi:aminoglycoside 6'-N-acetyltransferase I